MGETQADYYVHRAKSYSQDDLTIDWHNAEPARISHFRPESSSHRPLTTARLLHDHRGLHARFTVHDAFVLCRRTRYFDEVWKDSCVEMFVEPREGAGYFNFEFNCGGAFLCSWITNPERVPGGFKESVRIPWDQARQVQVRPSLVSRIDPEIPGAVDWTLECHIPLAVLEVYTGSLGDLTGQVWRGNFFKCAEDNSHPHWAAWSPVDEFNFHLPRCFGHFRFL
jgi:hypothetical protein